MKYKPIFVASTFALFTIQSSNAYAMQGLSELLKKAENHDPFMAQMASEVKSVEQSRYLVTSALKPYAGASLQGAILKSSDELYDLNNLSIGVEVNQSLYNRKVYSQLNQADKRIILSELKYKSAYQQLMLRLSQAYFDVLMAQSDLQLILSKEKTDISQLQKIDAAYEAGLVNLVDLLEAEANLNTTQADKISYESSLKNVIDNLEKLTGEKIVSLSGLNHQTLHSNQNMMIFAEAGSSKSSSDSLSVEMARLASEIAQDEVTIQKQANDVTIKAFARYERSEYSAYDSQLAFQYGDRNNLTVGINAHIELYDGGLNKTQVTQARHNANTAAERLREVQEDQDVKVKIAIRNIERSRAQVLAYQKLLTSSQAFLEATEVSYESGLKELVDLLNARTSQVSTEQKLIKANYSLALEKIKLKLLLNQLSTKDFEKLDMLLNHEITINIEN